MSQSVTVTVEESDRQMLLLALAELSIIRPGWLTQLRALAVAFSHAQDDVDPFERFRETAARRLGYIGSGGGGGSVPTPPGGGGFPGTWR